MERRRPQSGMSLVEVLVVLTIIALTAGTVAMSFRSVRRMSTKAAAGRLAAAIRYTYDRSVSTGSYYRIVFDFGGRKYWAEKSDTRYYLSRDKERASKSGKGGAEEEEKERERKRREEELRNQPQMTGMARELLPPPTPPPAKFEAFKDANLPQVELRNVRFRDIYTTRQPEPYTAGKAYLYFFPDGHTERALIQLEDEDEDVYALLVQPLTGRVQVKAGAQDVDREFDRDDEGREVAR